MLLLFWMDQRLKGSLRTSIPTHIHFKGLLVSEIELNPQGKEWPAEVFVAMDMHGENQRVALQPEKCQFLGVCARCPALKFNPTR